MTEHQITDFDRWFDSELDPELNLTLEDKELCRHAWQAALSHAEGFARNTPNPKNPTGFKMGDWFKLGNSPFVVIGEDDSYLYSVHPYTGGWLGVFKREPNLNTLERIPHPAPQVAVPESILALVRFLAQTWAVVDRFVYENCEGHALQHYPVVQGTKNQFNLQAIGEQPFDPALLHAGVEFMLAAAPTAPAGDIPQVTAYDHTIPVRTTSSDDPKLNTPQPTGNACTNCWGTEVDAAGNPCPHPEWKRPIAPAGEPAEIPEIGSQWRHRNGNVYTVESITNGETERPGQYPVTVVYRGENGKLWSRPASDWHRSMTFESAPATEQPVSDPDGLPSDWRRVVEGAAAMAEGGEHE